MEPGYFATNRTPDVVIRGIKIGDEKATKQKLHQIILNKTGLDHKKYKSFFHPNSSESYFTVYIKCEDHTNHYYIANTLNNTWFENRKITATINSNEEKNEAKIFKKIKQLESVTTTAIDPIETTQLNNNRLMNANSMSDLISFEAPELLNFNNSIQCQTQAEFGTVLSLYTLPTQQHKLFHHKYHQNKHKEHTDAITQTATNMTTQTNDPLSINAALETIESTLKLIKVVNIDTIEDNKCPICYMNLGETKCGRYTRI